MQNKTFSLQISKQLILNRSNLRKCLKNFERRFSQKIKIMATYQDPVKCFAPLEVIERLLEIRAECGFSQSIFLDNSLDLAQFLDAYGFDVYSFSMQNEKINYGDYRTVIVPGGDAVHASMTAH